MRLSPETIQRALEASALVHGIDLETALTPGPRDGRGRVRLAAAAALAGLGVARGFEVAAAMKISKTWLAPTQLLARKVTGEAVAAIKTALVEGRTPVASEPVPVRASKVGFGVDHERDARIVRDRLKGDRPKDIAAREKISEGSVYNALKRAGPAVLPALQLVGSPAGARQPGRTPVASEPVPVRASKVGFGVDHERDARIVRDRLNGDRPKDIAAREKISESSVYSALKRAGPPDLPPLEPVARPAGARQPGPVRGPQDPAQAARVIAARMAGKRPSEIAEIEDLHHETVRKYIRAATSAGTVFPDLAPMPVGNPQRDERIVSARKAGQTPAAIAAAEGLGVTQVYVTLRHAVARGEVFPGLKAAKPPSPTPAVRRSVRPIVRPVSAPVCVAEPFPEDHSAWAPLEGVTPVRLIHHRHGCRWPVNVDGEREPMVCNGSVHPGSPYCAPHAWLSMPKDRRPVRPDREPSHPLRAAA